MDYYEEFKNSCFVDTLDNIGSLNYGGKQHNMFGFSAENAERIKKQNDKKISVIIGNPPYNANQQNENDNNKNREYKAVDKRIKDTFIFHSTAQKTKVYDMYARFLRWAMDRINKNGIISFITNRSFVDSRTFDGFRRCAEKDFQEISIIDLGGNIRENYGKNLKIGNVFDIQIGVCIAFFIKNEEMLIDSSIDSQNNKSKIFYYAIKDEETKREKLKAVSNLKIREIQFTKILPDKNSNWLNLAGANDWEDLIPIISKDVKAKRGNKAIFELFSLGVVTNRDEWAYDLDKNNLSKKIKYFIDTYTDEQNRWNLSNKNVKINDFVNRTIKWTSELEGHLKKGSTLLFRQKSIKRVLYRPFYKTYTYYEKVFTHRLYQQEYIFPINENVNNKLIGIMGNDSPKPFTVLSFDCLTDLNSLSSAAGGTKCLPFYRYENRKRIENISDWALEQFRTHYQGLIISKENIFHYVYAVLHNPAYRSKYELNLKREFPRIPFYTDFAKWAKWGQDLMALHIDYETVPPYALVRKDIESKKAKKSKGELFADQEQLTDLMSNYEMEYQPKPKLKANKEEGKIEIDEITTLSGIPAAAWEYKLGNRCALEWILDQYKESKPSDVTIADKFNNYKFADYKESVIELLMCVCTVSVETQKIVSEMNE